MMKAGVTVEGIGKLLKNIDKLEKDIHKAIKKGVDRTALAVETDAKKKLKADGHIITGRLFSSIHAELKEGEDFGYKDKDGKQFDGSLGEKIAEEEAVAGTNVEYAPYIEYGTKYFSGDSFLGFAALKQSKEVGKRVAEEINKIKI